MSKKTIIIIVVVLVLAIFAGVVVGMVMWKKSSNAPQEIIKHSLTMDDMYCNIKDSKRIMKLKITIESTNIKTIENLTEKQFLIRDEVNKIVRNKTDEELQGKDGQVNLQEAIKNSLIELFEDEIITNIYFNDFIIQ
jgi:flagellar FliL protein